ncbi:MAG: Na+/H+ antiporter [Actinomycetota bacterium]
MNETGGLLLALSVAIAALSTVARLINVPYPIMLVLGGLAIGLVPGLPDVTLNPDLVLIIFLPPLLYAAAFFSSLRDLRRDLRSITLNAVALVALTAAGVAIVAHTLIDGMSWAAAFALGAIVAPTDPIAATAITKRLGAPRRIVTVIEGEALINDGTALVLYRSAVAAAVGGSFSLLSGGLDFIVSAAGGIAVGLVVGAAITEVRRRIEDTPVEITISLATGYAAYLPAEAIGVSGVLAAVTAGIYLGWMAPQIASVDQRLQGRPVWELLQFLLNAVLFVLIGLQLPSVVGDLSGISTATLVGYAAATCAAVVGVRLIWFNTMPYVIRALDRRPQQRARRADWRTRLIVAWAGMRGAVSLAAALALPLQTDAGAAFPQRNLIIFLAFSVILFTLVVQGLTLPWLLRRLKVCDDGREEQDEEVLARLHAAAAALERLEELAREDWTRDDTIERVRNAYEYRQRRFNALRDGDDSDGYEDRSISYQRLLRELLEAQRRAVVELRNSGEISNDVMTRVERELDLEDSRLEI